MSIRQRYNFLCFITPPCILHTKHKRAAAPASASAPTFSIQYPADPQLAVGDVEGVVQVTQVVPGFQFVEVKQVRPEINNIRIQKVKPP